MLIFTFKEPVKIFIKDKMFSFIPSDNIEKVSFYDLFIDTEDGIRNILKRNKKFNPLISKISKIKSGADLPLCLNGITLDKNFEPTVLPKNKELFDGLENQMIAKNDSELKVAIFNAFGLGLGDNLMGASVFQIALSVLQSFFPVLKVDIISSWLTDNPNKILDGAEWVNRHVKTPLSLYEFNKYHAYYDFSQFSTLTAFKDDPWPDFQLKILGIDPHVIPDELKKTRYAVKNISDFNRGLNKISENKSTIFIQAKTSTFLRTMPEESLSALLGKLSAMGFTLISDDEYVIDNANKNYINLVKIICHSFDELMGVVMSVDAVITCDTFMLHFSNAANKKTIGIFNCMSSESYTYLPYQANLIRINVDKEYIFSNKVVMSEDEVKDMGKEKYFYEMWQNSVNEVINNLEL